MELMEYIYKGEDILFTFKHEATEFIKRNKLQAELIEDSFIDEDHYQIKGYKSKLYWIAR